MLTVHILISATPNYPLASVLGATLIVVLMFGGLYLWDFSKRRTVQGKPYIANRAQAETLCSWEYSAAEWRLYSTQFELGDNPVGAARVRITPLDLWFTDDAEMRRIPISSTIMMVTDCEYSGKLLKMRVRSHSSSGKNEHYRRHDYFIPVPANSEQGAAAAVRYFKNFMAQNPKKLDWVTPSDYYLAVHGITDCWWDRNGWNGTDHPKAARHVGSGRVSGGVNMPEALPLTALFRAL